MVNDAVTGEIEKNELKDSKNDIASMKSEMHKVVVGQEHAMNALIRAVIADGHVLIEGVPGIAKTLLMVSLAQVTGAEFKRIQFTPDMLPSDITGAKVYDPKKGFYYNKGPLFTNFVLADEINRAPPKVQSALLEAMQERKVTLSDQTMSMVKPFLVLATQNTVESIGVYILPAAQLDRFLFKLVIGHPEPSEEKFILKKNVSYYSLEDFGLNQVVTLQRLLRMQSLVHRIYLSSQIEDYIVNLVDATRRPAKYGIASGKYLQLGASPRASLGLYIGSKAQALMEGSTFVTPEHVKEVAPDVMRHRMLINYEGQAEEITPDLVVQEVLEKVEVP